MWRNLSLLLLLVIVAAAGGFVWITSQTLPMTVASHFNAAGQANGFSPRGAYINLMLGMTVLAPLLAAVLPRRAVTRIKARINLPNGGYWLAPERREATIDFICGQMAVFGMLLAGFLAYGHWLVVQANQMHPPTLPASAFFGGLIVFIAGIVLMIASLFWRFRRVED
jgi:uncharacterized membrane protein